MHFSTIASLLAAVASVASAQNIITFKSLDNQDRTAYFTANAGLAAIPNVVIPGGQSVDVTIPDAWIGNVFTIINGNAVVPGMLAEFAFNSWMNLCYYDVSAIVNPADIDNIGQIIPFEDPGTPISGCGLFPCNNAYYAADDVQTKASTQTHYIVTVGTNGLSARDLEVESTPSYSRNYVLGKF